MKRSAVATVLIVGLFAGSAFGAVKPKTPAAGNAPITAQAMRLAFYDYDKQLALNAKTEQLTDQLPALAKLRTRYRVEFDSAHDQRVVAIYNIPRNSTPPYPAVVLLAGSGGHKDTDYIRIAGDFFNTLGYATISLDAQYHGERSKADRTGDFHIITNPTNRDAWVQTVIDLRRAVDFLQAQKQIDGKHIGYLGFSQGGIVGATFLGVEPRITCACLAVAGGGMERWAIKLGIKSAADLAQIHQNAFIVEPSTMIARYSPRPLLMLSAKRDEMIPHENTMILYNAAGGAKKLVWFDSGHVLPPTALVSDAKAFFVKYLGKRL